MSNDNYRPNGGAFHGQAHADAQEAWHKDHGKSARQRRAAERLTRKGKKPSRRVTVPAQNTSPRMIDTLGEQVVDPLPKWERDLFDELEASPVAS